MCVCVGTCVLVCCRSCGLLIDSVSARLQAPGTWDNDAWVTRYAETEGHKKDWVLSFVARVRACRRLVQEQLARPTAAPAQPCVPRAVEATLTADQHLFLAQIQEEVRARGEARSRADADEHEDVLQALCVGFPYLKAHCLLGGRVAGRRTLSECCWTTYCLKSFPLCMLPRLDSSPRACRGGRSCCAPRITEPLALRAATVWPGETRPSSCMTSGSSTRSA